MSQYMEVQLFFLIIYACNAQVHAVFFPQLDTLIAVFKNFYLAWAIFYRTDIIFFRFHIAYKSIPSGI